MGLVCWQCADGNPNNDLMGILNVEPGDSVEGTLATDHTPPSFFGMGMSFTGTATTFEGLLEGQHGRALELVGFADPERRPSWRQFA